MQKRAKRVIIIISLMIVGYLSSGLLPFPYGLGSNLAVTGIGIFFLVKFARKK